MSDLPAVLDPRTVTLAQVAELVDQARAAREVCEDLDTAREIKRRLEAVHKYIADKKGRAAMERELRLTEVLIGRLLGTAPGYGHREESTFDSPALHTQERKNFRALAEHAGSWPDFALERWSDRDRRTPGWAQKQLACDYLAYAFVPTAECYLLPFATLQRAWRRHGRAWVASAEDGEWVTDSFKRGRDGFGVILAHNVDNGRRWVTESIAVPRTVLLAALTDVMRVSWLEEAA